MFHDAYYVLSGTVREAVHKAFLTRRSHVVVGHNSYVVVKPYKTTDAVRVIRRRFDNGAIIGMRAVRMGG